MRVLRIKKEYLDLVKDGQKLYEVRALSSRTKGIEAGDQLLLMSGPHKLVVDVVSARVYEGRAELLKAVPSRRLGAVSAVVADEILRGFYPGDPPLVALRIKPSEA